MHGLKVHKPKYFLSPNLFFVYMPTIVVIASAQNLLIPYNLDIVLKNKNNLVEKDGNKSIGRKIRPNILSPDIDSA